MKIRVTPDTLDEKKRKKKKRRRVAVRRTLATTGQVSL